MEDDVMKKGASFFIMICMLAYAFTQESALYDVNYDKPVETTPYNEEEITRQNAYIHYDNAVKYIEKKLVAGEAERLMKEITDKLTADFTERYEDKKNREVAALIASETKRLTKEITDKLTADFTKRYENKKNKEVAQARTEIEEQFRQNARNDIYTSELKKIHAEESEKLTKEITAKLTAELTQQFEDKKNTEIALLHSQLKQQIYDETKTVTERLKTILFFSTLTIIIIFLILVIAKSIMLFLDFQNYTKQYFSILKNTGNDDTITKKLENERKHINKTIMNRAFNKANEKYQRYKNICAVSQTEQKLINLKPGILIRKWKETYTAYTAEPSNAQNDMNACSVNGNYHQCFNEIYSSFFENAKKIIAIFEDTRRSFDILSFDEKENAIKLFSAYSIDLCKIATNIKTLPVDNLDDEFIKKINDTAELYMNLSNKFKEAF